MTTVEVLILGAGWTSDFLIPLLIKHEIKFAATTRDGRPRSGQETIKFEFNPDLTDPSDFQSLPDAQTVLITFPIHKSGVSRKFVNLWKQSHSGTKAAFIQFGSTGIWNGDQTVQRLIWLGRRSAFDTSNDRARAETELLELAPAVPTTALDLTGLWGGQRHPRNWLNMVAPTKEALSKKDIARAILAVHSNFPAASGQRWLLTDTRVYDWWDLASARSNEASHGSSVAGDSASSPAIGQHGAWVRDLMKDNDIRALPRPPSAFDCALDSREFWDTFGLSPVKTLLSA